MQVTYRNIYSGATFVVTGPEEIQKRMKAAGAWKKIKKGA